MSVHAVYVPGRIAPGSPDAVEAAVIVRERFSFAALVLPLPWLLFRRAWREFLLFAALTVAAALVMHRFAGGASPGVMAGLELLAGLFIGLSAADIRGKVLERRGHRLADIVVAPDADAALARFAERELARAEGGPAHAPDPSRRPLPGPGPSSAATSGERNGVIGLFPEAQR